MRLRRLFKHSTVQQLLALLLAVLMGTSAVRAEDHVLTLTELHQSLSQANAGREANRADIDRFFSETRVQHVLKTTGINADQLKSEISLLSSDEQAKLATRVRSAESSIAAGELSDFQLTIVIIAAIAFCFMVVLVLAFE